MSLGVANVQNLIELIVTSKIPSGVMLHFQPYPLRQSIPNFVSLKMSLCPSGRVSESFDVRLYIQLGYNELFATKTYNHGTALMPNAGKD